MMESTIGDIAGLDLEKKLMRLIRIKVKMMNLSIPPFKEGGGIFVYTNMLKQSIVFKRYYLAFVGFLIFSSCQKPDANNTPTPAPGPVPVISFVSATPTTVHQFKDSIIFTVNYKDGDGDLGNANADSSSLFLVDARQSLTEPYHIAPLAPGTAKISISGTLRIKLDHTALLNGNASETTTYSIYMKDRAGHTSNTVTSPQITILP
jgi:hypothetical protein